MKPSTSSAGTLVSSREKHAEETGIGIRLDAFKEEMKNMIISLFEEQSIMSTTVLKEIQQTNINIENSIAFLTAQNEDLKKKIDSLESQIKQDNEHIIILENKIEDNQRIDRKTNLEIKCVPLKKENTKEDLLNMVLKLSETLGLNVQKSEVKDTIKVNKKKLEESTIIVEFTNTFAKADIQKAARIFNNKNKDNKLSAKHLGITSTPDSPIYISENLTQKSARLFFLARELKTGKKYKYCWTNYGKVYLRLDDVSPVITITSESQVQQLCNM